MDCSATGAQRDENQFITANTVDSTKNAKVLMFSTSKVVNKWNDAPLRVAA